MRMRGFLCIGTIFLALARVEQILCSHHAVPLDKDLLKADIQKLIETNVFHGENVTSKSPFTTELRDEIKGWLAHFPLGRLAKDVERGTAEGANYVLLPNPDDENCERDYSAFCPEGWADEGDGSGCRASITYTGPCENRNAFSLLTPQLKLEFAERCKVQWPCLSRCTQDFTHPCPAGWQYVDTGVCRAPSSYKDKCVRHANLLNHNEEHKRQWAEICNVRWPCKPGCDSDYSSTCPHGWAEVSLPEGQTPTALRPLAETKKVCRAPDTYIGPCSPVQKQFLNATVRDKTMFEKECNVKWSCGTDPSEAEEAEEFRCPAGWTASPTASQPNMCKPSAELYQGPCNATTDFGSMKRDEKTAWSLNCQTFWPQKEDCERDYSAVCPHGWHEKGTHCVAPSSYQGRCPYKFSFYNYTTLMKHGFADRCHAPWPCANAASGAQQHAEGRHEGHGMDFARNGPLNVLTGEVTLSGKEVEPGSQLPPTPVASNDTLSGDMKLQEHLQLLATIALMDKTSRVRAAAHEASTILNSEGSDAPIVFRFRQLNSSSSTSLPRLLEIGQHEFRAPAVGMGSRQKAELLEKEKQNEDNKDNTQFGKGSYPDIEASGLIPKKELWKLKLQKKFTEPDTLMNLIGFPEAGRHYFRSLLLDDEAAGSESYGGYTPQKCVKGLRKPCPRGWTAHGVFCQAPEIYQAKRRCPSVMPFGAMEESEKSRYQRVCGVEWECAHCHHDYVRSRCPQGWIHEGNGICRAPAGFRSYNRERCPTVVNFKYMVPELRKAWALECGADWPCFGAKEYDLSNPCPKDWLLVDSNRSMCAAPQDYKGPCKNPLLEVADNPQKKEAIMRECNVKWPEQDFCPQTYWQMCPYGWTYSLKSGCSAPKATDPQLAYEGPCPSVQKFDRFPSDYYREMYTERCHAAWPCDDDQCEQDFSRTCPLRWWLRRSLLKKKVYCVPNRTYKGPCLGKYDMTGKSFASKRQFAYQCEVKWPCGGYLLGRLRIPYVGWKWSTAKKRKDTAGRGGLLRG